jgi:serine/threonine protein kinase
LDHINIVQFFQGIYTAKRVHIVLEFIDGRTLEQLLDDGGGQGLTESVACSIFIQIVIFPTKNLRIAGILWLCNWLQVHALMHMHARGVCHRYNPAMNYTCIFRRLLLDVEARDIKLDNIFVIPSRSGSSGCYIVKIIDFGIGELMRPGHRLSLQCGTPAYAAPEIVQDKKYSGVAVDTWSLGVLLYLMLTGKYPFQPCPTREHMFKKICAGEYDVPAHVSQGARQVLAGLLQPDPEKRIKLAAVGHLRLFYFGALVRAKQSITHVSRCCDARGRWRRHLVGRIMMREATEVLCWRRR